MEQAKCRLGQEATLLLFLKDGIDGVGTASHGTTDTPDTGSLLKMAFDQGAFFVRERGGFRVERERPLAGATEATGTAGGIGAVTVDGFALPTVRAGDRNHTLRIPRRRRRCLSDFKHGK